MRETRRHRLSIRSQDEYYLNTILKCMDPTTLEMATLLDENSNLRDAADIREVALSWKRDGVFQEPEAVEIAEYQSDDDDDDDFRPDVDFDVDIRGADDI